MPNFAQDRTGSYGSLTTYYPKVQQESGSLTTHVSSSEFNGLVQGLISLSYALTSGSLFGFVRSTTAPTSLAGPSSDFMWLSSSGYLMFRDRGGVDRFLSGNVNPGSGQAAYYQTVSSYLTIMTQRVTMSFDEVDILARSVGAVTSCSLGTNAVLTSSIQTVSNKTFVTPVLTGTVSGDHFFSSSIRVRHDAVTPFGSGTYGVKVENTTAATNGSNPLSPAVVFSTTAFHGTASISQNVKAAIQLLPLQRAAEPDQELSFYTSINNAAWNKSFGINSSGITASLLITTNVTSSVIVPAWINVTYQNSYTDFGLGYPTSSYWKDPSGRVHFRMAAKGGTNGAVICNIPALYRPSHQLLILGYVDVPLVPANSFFLIKQSGDVQCLNVVGNTAALMWASWYAEK